MRLPFVTASLFIAGSLLNVGTAAPAAHVAAQIADRQFELGELNITTTAELGQDDQTVASAEPAPAETVQAPKNKETKKPKKVYVTVQKGDTLTKIARAHGTTYKRIFDANKDLKNPDILAIGQKLRIPAPDEKLASRAIPKPAPKPAAAPNRSQSTQLVASTAPAVASGSVWDRLAACESGGNWQINTGNGYYGGLQFLPSTWRAVGGTGLPHQHSREEQIKRAEILLARSGWGQWPQCARKIGML